MTLHAKLVLAAVVKGVPYIVIMAAAAVHSARRRSVAAAVLALGVAGIAAHNIWSVFMPIWLRNHTPEEYGRMILPYSIAYTAGWYVASVAIAVLLFQKRNASDNNTSKLTSGGRADASPGGSST